MKYAYTEPVRYSETDESGCMSVEALINLFQDTSTMQSEKLGRGVGYLKEKGKAWILSSWQIEINEMPFLHNEVTCTTWGHAFNDFYGHRNFTLTGKDTVYAYANSVWVLYDVHAGRPVRVDEETIRLYDIEEAYPMEYASRKIAPVKEGEAGEPFLIRKHHLDTNHHVNNAQYIRFALDHLPESVRVRSIRADYRMQARLGDTIYPLIEEGEGRIRVALNNEAKRPFATVEFMLCGIEHSGNNT